ncbi:MAG: PilZ domain-containing protein [Clostridia bacterium]|nr:PilZ domain-containing protein [Deltaproteobacteria bacterium]
MSSKLKHLVIADPNQDTAQLIADACERLADETTTVTSGGELLDAVDSIKPQLLIISLELTRPDTIEVIPKLQKLASDMLIMTTYRELSVPLMEKLGRLGLENFLAQPADATEIFRAASKRFQMHFRRHDRHAVTLEVYRADGVLVGRTRDISEGGLSIDALHPVHVDESQLLDLMIADQKPLRVRCRVLHVDGVRPAPVLARIQFEKLWGPDQKRLADYIKSLQAA